jgi:predicted restriction endonuclease
LKKAENFTIILYKRDNIEQLINDAILNDLEYVSKRYKIKERQLQKYYNRPDWFVENCTFKFIMFQESNFSELLSLININDFDSSHDELRSALLNLGELSIISKTKRRREQQILRNFLIGNRDEYTCCFCGEVFDVNESICAHVKHHSECAIEEKVDVNNVLLACPICDYFFENGFFCVENGIIISSIVKAPKLYISNINLIIGKKCPAFIKSSMKYFNWHWEYHNGKIK